MLPYCTQPSPALTHSPACPACPPSPWPPAPPRCGQPAPSPAPRSGLPPGQTGAPHRHSARPAEGAGRDGGAGTVRRLGASVSHGGWGCCIEHVPHEQYQALRAVQQHGSSNTVPPPPRRTWCVLPSATLACTASISAAACCTSPCSSSRSRVADSTAAVSCRPGKGRRAGRQAGKGRVLKCGCGRAAAACSRAV